MYAEFACVRKESEREKKSGGERETEREREREGEREGERDQPTDNTVFRAG